MCSQKEQHSFSILLVCWKASLYASFFLVCIEVPRLSNIARDFTWFLRQAYLEQCHHLSMSSSTPRRFQVDLFCPFAC